MRSLLLTFLTLTALSFSGLFGFGKEEIGIWSHSLSFSPDGQYLLLSIYRKGSWQVYRLKKDGSELIEITSGPGRHVDARYSPDGSKIVFSYSRSIDHEAEHDLFLIDTDGSNRLQLTTGPANDSSSTFSPDGKRIYFLRSRWFGKYSPFARAIWHEKDVYSIKIDGTDLRRITSGSYYGISTPAISPDEKNFVAWLPERKDREKGNEFPGGGGSFPLTIPVQVEELLFRSWSVLDVIPERIG